MLFTLKRTFSKAVAITLTVLFILWLFSPWIIKQVIKSQIPESWKISSLDIGYPVFDGISFRNLSITTSTDKIIVDQILFPLSGANNIKINQFEIILGQNNPTKLTKPKDLLLPYLTPFKTRYSLEIKSIQVADKEFELHGTVVATPNAIQFNGSFEYLQQSIPLEINLLGLNGKEPLLFSTKLGKHQHLTVEYDWRDENVTQTVKLLGSVSKPLLILMQKAKLVSTQIDITQPEIGFDVVLEWPTWPRIKNQLFNAKMRGEIEFNFDKIDYHSWRVDKAAVKIKALNNQHVSLSTEQPIVLEKMVEDDVLRLTQSQLKNAQLLISEKNIQLTNSGKLFVEWQENKLQLENININMDSLTKKITTSQDVYLTISKKNLPNNIIVEGESKLFSKLSVELLESQVTMNFIENKVQLPQKIHIEGWMLERPMLHLNPFKLKFDYASQEIEKIIENLALKATINTELSTKLKAKEAFLLENHCDISLQKSALNVICNSFKKGKDYQKIDTSIHLNLIKKAVEAAIVAKEITLSKWNFEDLIDEKLRIESGLASFEFYLNTDFHKLTKFTPNNFLSEVDNRSQFFIEDMDLSYKDISFKKVKINLKKNIQKSVDFSLQAENLLLASGLKITNLEGEYLYHEKDLNIEKKSAFSLEFSIFDGQAKLTSTDYNLFVENYQMQASLSKINLTEIFNWAEIGGLTGTGVLEGGFPLSVTEQGIFINQGEFTTTQAGVIRYQQSQNNTETDNIALQALENFHYTELSLKIDQLEVYFEKQGSFSIPIRVVGRNPLSQFDNNFAINPLLKGVIPENAWSHLITGDVKK